MSEDASSIEDIILELLTCATSWEPDARLLGNVRAADIAKICRSHMQTIAEVKNMKCALNISTDTFVDEIIRLKKVLAYAKKTLSAIIGQSAAHDWMSIQSYSNAALDIIEATLAATGKDG